MEDEFTPENSSEESTPAISPLKPVDEPLAETPPIIERFLKLNSTDIHISSGEKPYIRINGDLAQMPGEEVLSQQDVAALTLIILGKEHYSQFLRGHECDYAVSLISGERMRINASVQRGRIALSIRLLSSKFMPLETLGLSRRIVSYICTLRHGLVLVTGSTGSGKSTTLASFINELNMTRPAHIVTIEEPIEYLHKNKLSYVTQREVGSDTESFSEALRRSFRQDPDIVLIGEMRDEETIRAALTLSETGHLTLGTLHTSEAFQTVIRIIGSFPSTEQERARQVLATTLRVVICQQLLPRLDGTGRVLATETLVVNSIVRALIRENKLHQIPIMMKNGTEQGMSTMNQSLVKLVRQRIVSQDVASSFSPDREDFMEEVMSRS
jgi:twitching motility protein PilT